VMLTCPTPNKMVYTTRGEASEANRQMRRARARYGGVKDQKPYLCECGRWHLASKAHRGRKRQATRSQRPAY
jgi:hypothetical protein